MKSEKKIDDIIMKPIGIIKSPFTTPEGTPIQPKASKGIEGKIEIFPEYVEGLKDLEGFSHIILLYKFHFIKKTKLKVKPYMDEREHGVFSTRAPSRPNPIGLSVVSLLKIEENVLYIKDVDIVDGTPLIDIKPYVPEFDKREDCRIGWLSENVKKLPSSKDDGRFLK